MWTQAVQEPVPLFWQDTPIPTAFVLTNNASSLTKKAHQRLPPPEAPEPPLVDTPHPAWPGKLGRRLEHLSPHCICTHHHTASSGCRSRPADLRTASSTRLSVLGLTSPLHSQTLDSHRLWTLRIKMFLYLLLLIKLFKHLPLSFNFQKGLQISNIFLHM